MKILRTQYLIARPPTCVPFVSVSVLAETFGDAYIEYKKRVRRWIWNSNSFG